jgi:hypothetical protein
MDYLIIDKLGYRRLETFRNEFIFTETFTDGYDSHHQNMAHDPIIISVLLIRGYSGDSHLFVDYFTVNFDHTATY